MKSMDSQSMGSQSHAAGRQSLAESLVTLAGTAADVPTVDDQLRTLAQLAVDRVAAVEYAAITVPPHSRCSVVAAGSALAGAVEDAVAGRGALAEPVAGVPAARTMAWPGFRDEAAGMGLRAASVPVYCGTGEAVATLDLYGHDADAMTSLAEALAAAGDPDRPLPDEDDERQPLDPGAEELALGYAEAVTVRATIRLALTLIGDHTDAANPYLALRLRAADRDLSLPDAATEVILTGR